MQSHQLFYGSSSSAKVVKIVKINKLQRSLFARFYFLILAFINVIDICSISFPSESSYSYLFFLYYRWIIGIIYVFLQRVFSLAHVRVDIPNEDTTFYLLNFSSANYHLDTGDYTSKILYPKGVYA